MPLSLFCGFPPACRQAGFRGNDERGGTTVEMTASVWTRGEVCHYEKLFEKNK